MHERPALVLGTKGGVPPTTINGLPGHARASNYVSPMPKASAKVFANGRSNT